MISRVVSGQGLSSDDAEAFRASYFDTAARLAKGDGQGKMSDEQRYAVQVIALMRAALSTGYDGAEDALNAATEKSSMRVLEMERMVDEYAAGRSLLVLDEMGRQVMQCENVVDVYPLREAPDEVDQSRLAQNYTGVGRVTGVDDEGNTLGLTGAQVTFIKAHLKQLCYFTQSSKMNMAYTFWF